MPKSTHYLELQLEEVKNAARFFQSEFDRIHKEYLELQFCSIDMGLCQGREYQLLQEIESLAKQLRKKGVEPTFVHPELYTNGKPSPEKASPSHHILLEDIIGGPDEDFSDNEKSWNAMIKSGLKELPYVETTETVTETNCKYNPNYGDNRTCCCGHSYYRHFDSYEGMEPVGCKYCECRVFVEDVSLTTE